MSNHHINQINRFIKNIDLDNIPAATVQLKDAMQAIANALTELSEQVAALETDLNSVDRDIDLLKRS